MEARGRLRGQQTRARGRRGPSDTSARGQPEQLPLPHATRSLFPGRLRACRNIGLLFDRYVRYQAGWQLGEYAVDPQGRKRRGAKLFNFEGVCRAQMQCNDDKTWREMHGQFITRWKTTARAFGAELFAARPEWRLVVGLGGKTALEAGFTFDRIYGFPIIPGAALKGLARSFALWQVAGALGVRLLPQHKAVERVRDARNRLRTPMEKLEAVLLADDERVAGEVRAQLKMPQAERDRLKELLEDREVPDDAPIRHGGLESQRETIALFRRVFGTTHAAGQAVFLTAVPAQSPVLEVDVMNVHYQDYYSGKKDGRDQLIPPADYLSPNPIPFLTVGRSGFLFAVGWRGPVDDEARARAIEWLKRGLTELGVGGKTAAGYGYMEVA